MSAAQGRPTCARFARVFGVAALSLVAASPVAAQWPQRGGGDRDVRVEGKGLFVEWPEEGPRLAWKRALGEGESAGGMFGPRFGVALAQPGAALDERAQSIVDAALEPLRSNSGPGCVAAIQRGGRTVAMGAGGLASLEYHIPLSSSTPLHVGSIAKQFIAAIAFMLDEQGPLDLDAPVTVLVPELPLRFRSVTGRHLLTHTSGMRDYLQAAHHAGAGLNEPLSREQILAFLVRQSRLDFPPGTDASYSNSNYFLLSTMIERVEDETIGVVAQRLIFEPLGMRSSRFLIDGLEVVPGRARGYRETGDGVHRLHEPVPGVGGMLTTLDDLLLWARHLRHMQTDDDPLLARLTTPAQLLDGRTTMEAAGLKVDIRFNRRVVEHNGSNRGFNAYLGWYPDEDVFVAMMCNVRQARATSRAHDISAALFDEEPPSRSSYPKMNTEAMERLAAYAGVYRATQGPGALELELDAPHAIVTLYGDHPSDSRTASNVLQPTDEGGIFNLFGLSPGGHLLLETDATTAAIVFELEGSTKRRFVKVTPPDQDDLEHLAGRFRCDDLNVIYVLSIKDGALVVAIVRPDGRTVDRGQLTPVTRDVYFIQHDPVSNIHLERDARDHVIGFELNEPRLRGVAFARLSAPALPSTMP